MDPKQLPNKFFASNPLKYMSAAILTHFKMVCDTDAILDEINSESGVNIISETRKRAMEAERLKIMETDDPATLVEFARKIVEMPNHRILISKILQLEDQTLPILLRRFRTCSVDHFIEIAVRVFVEADRKYVQQLREMYSQIRAPYAQAGACLVFGMCGMKEEIPFLLKEYERFQKEHAKETFDQHPLMALYILHGKL